jgi:hypothetical protein
MAEVLNGKYRVQNSEMEETACRVFHSFCAKLVTNPVENIQYAPESGGSSRLLRI